MRHVRRILLGLHSGIVMVYDGFIAQGSSCSVEGILAIGVNVVKEDK
jgi:hypothetical protein